MAANIGLDSAGALLKEVNSQLDASGLSPEGLAAGKFKLVIKNVKRRDRYWLSEYAGTKGDMGGTISRQWDDAINKANAEAYNLMRSIGRPRPSDPNYARGAFGKAGQSFGTFRGTAWLRWKYDHQTVAGKNNGNPITTPLGTAFLGNLLDRYISSTITGAQRGWVSAGGNGARALGGL